jgi:hypothetical protein
MKTQQSMERKCARPLTLHLWIANKSTKVGMGGEGTSLKEWKLTPLQPSHLKIN